MKFFFGNMKWLTVFLSAICHYILTLLEDNGCAAGSGEATSSVLPWLPQGAGGFLEGERMCLPGGQLALSRKTSVMRGRAWSAGETEQGENSRAILRVRQKGDFSCSNSVTLQLKTFWPESKSGGKAACQKAIEYTGGCSSLGGSLFFPLF